MSNLSEREKKQVEEEVNQGEDGSKTFSQRQTRKSNNRNQRPNNRGSTVKRPGRLIGADDDISNQYFMSEPSLSEEGDSSSDSQQSQGDSGESSGSFEGPQMARSSTHPPPPPTAHQPHGRAPMNTSAGIYSSSPGNTSLSSWDSPHPRHQVHLSFSPDRQSAAIPTTNYGGTNTVRFNQQGVATEGTAFNMSSNSTSPASITQQQQATEFLETLRQQSHGAMMVEQPGFSSFPSFSTSSQGAASYQYQIGGIMRSHGNVSGPPESNSVEGRLDDTVVMTLSVSEDEKDTIEGSLQKVDQSHSFQKLSKEATDSRLLKLEGKGERSLLESGNWKQDNFDRETLTEQHMSTGEPTAVGLADSRRGMPSIRSRMPVVETAASDRQQYHPTILPVSLHQHSAQSRSHVDSTEAGDSGMRDAQYTASRLQGFERFGRQDDPSMLSQSLNQQKHDPESHYPQPHVGSLQNEANWMRMARSPHRIPQYFGSERSHGTWDPSLVQNRYPQYLPPNHSSQMEENVPYVAHSPNRQPQYFVTPQGEMSMPTYADSHHSEESETDTDENTGDEDIMSAEEYMSVQQNRIWVGENVQNLNEAENLLENPEFRGKMQNMMRRHSVFSNVSQPQEKVDRSYFVPKTSALDDDPKGCATFTCPRCKTVQREFFSVANAPQQFETATSYLGLYFGVYVIASLFIFGLKEGWSALDCIYFAVITLTTAGLGDFTPTSDDAKIICSIFIYFGVACIGLLLGSYIAGMLDDISHREATENRIQSCPNCDRIKHLKELAKHNGGANQRHFLSTRPVNRTMPNNPSGSFKDLAIRRQSFSMRPSSSIPSIGKPLSLVPPVKELPAINEGKQKMPNENWLAPAENERDIHGENSESDSCSECSDVHDVEMAPSTGVTNQYSSPQVPHTTAALSTRDPSTPPEIPTSPNLLGSPLTREIMGRQHHTRHISFDASGTSNTRSSVSSTARSRQFSGDLNFWKNMSVPEPETIPMKPPQISESCVDNQVASDDESEGSNDECDDESLAEEGTTSSDESLIEKGDGGVQNAKYVFLTLKEALVNSLLIIAVGSIGFYVIEGFTAVDSWYFTTSLLTTVGYGDICPVTNGGKLFATIYILVGGTILVNNMSMISMIPLELRKRRIERAVLTQFGDQLDDAALRELATGPLCQRLRLTPTRNDGLDECTREMFALAMLVRLGKVTEQDIKETFRAFRRLDVNNDGVLTSKSIIAGIIQKRRSLMQIPVQIATCGNPPPPQGTGSTNQPPTQPNVPFFKGWIGPRGSFHTVSQDGGSSERTSLLTDSAIYDSMSTNTGAVRT